MEDFFYPGFWSPVRPRAAAAPTTAKPHRPSKVVSIPVHFGGSEEVANRQPQVTAAAVPVNGASGSNPTASITRSSAALRFQSAFRGFVVRKNVRLVRSLEAEIDAIEREVKEREERLRRDGKERLRVSESLMSVLFRLDSVTGVRGYRRRAIRKAIALQEAVDAIASVEDGGEVTEANASREAMGADAPVEIPLETLDDGDKASSAIDYAKGEGDSQKEDSDTDVVAEEEESTAADATEETSHPNLPSEEDLSKDRAFDEANGANQATGGAPEDHHTEQSAADDVVQASMAQDELCAVAKTVESPAAGKVLSDPVLSSTITKKVVEEEGEKMRQVMEKLAEESRELKGLVAELCERNDMQCCLMSGLLRRVERLEKVVEMMGRKKRRQAADAKKGCARKGERGLS